MNVIARPRYFALDKPSISWSTTKASVPSMIWRYEMSITQAPNGTYIVRHKAKDQWAIDPR